MGLRLLHYALTIFVVVAHFKVWSGDLEANWADAGFWNCIGVILGSIAWIGLTLFLSRRSPAKLLSPEEAGERLKNALTVPRRFWYGFTGLSDKPPTPRSAVGLEVSDGH